MDGVIFASEDDFDRTAAATRYLEALRRTGGISTPVEKHVGLEVVIVKVTADEATETQYWEGVVTNKDFEAGVDEWFEEDEDSSDNPKVLVVTLDGAAPTQNKRYIGVLIGEHDGYPVVLVAVTADGGEIWARVTVVATSDPGAYTAVKGSLTAGTWADDSPTVTYTSVYRAPSNIAPPKIPIGQHVRLVPSPTMDGAYEIDAVGGMQTVEFTTDLGWGCTTAQTIQLTGRDLKLTVVAGSSSPKIITVGPIEFQSWNSTTCAMTTVLKNMVLNLCDLTGTFEDA